ncbi:MAG: MerR family transcriptional regulator [Abyssibacter sp.]|jgi:DNA-binding transcriptional MerR regulator|nr:MerR family transcriptional regulator [Abyssibacter sp.]MCK5858064.1 MerR family transcriptional regulator [Abyssibacter sp.]
MEGLQLGQAASETGIPVETIRYYERVGLVTPHRKGSGNYRLFDDEVISRLVFVRNAKALGFSLSQIRSLLKVQDADNRAEIKSIAASHLVDVEKRIGALMAIGKALTDAVNECDGKGGIDGCPIIEAIVDYENCDRSAALEEDQA